MIEKYITPDSFTYNFVKIGIFCVGGIFLFKSGKIVGSVLKNYI